MKVDSLGLINVLSHEDTRIDLGEYLTVLTGKSDSGKSVGVRGLRQSFLNEPAGIDLLRHAAKRGSVSEVITCGTDFDGKPLEIARRRGKSRNEYEVDGKPILAFGQGAPMEVSGRLRLSAHAFQIQSDGNFMLCERPGEVAKMMSATVGLAQIDAAYAAVAKLKTANDTELRCSAADLDRETKALALFAELEEASNSEEVWEHVAAELESAVSEEEGMTAIALSLDTIPTDASAAAKSAAILLANAERTGTFLEAALADQAGMVGIIESLAPIPEGNAFLPKLAQYALEKLFGIQGLLGMAQSESDEIAELVEAMAAVRRPAAIGIASAAVEAWQGVYKTCVAVEAESIEINGIVMELEAVLSDAEEILQSATDALYEMTDATARVEECDGEYYAFACHIKEIEEILDECDASNFMLKDVESDLKLYKAEHKTCPECGADQKHWRAS